MPKNFSNTNGPKISHNTNEQHRATQAPLTNSSTRVVDSESTKLNNDRKGEVVPKHVKTLFTKGHASSSEQISENNTAFNM